MSLRILVLGAGGIGGLIGGRLAQQGAEVVFLVRERRKRQLDEDGLRLESPFGNATIPVKAKLQYELCANFDIVLLTCKAYDLASAIESISPAMKGGAAVLPLLNGYAHIEQLNHAFGAHNVIPGTARIQATLTPEGVVRQLNDWQTITFGQQDGGVTERMQALKLLFDRTGIECKLSPDIVRDLWWKLVHLATVAGMTCAMRANIGEIVRTPEGSALLNRLLETNAAIAAHFGHRPDETFLETYRQLFGNRQATYEASMLRDLEKGSRVEGEHILGFMLKKCREAGLPDALHVVAYTHVRAYEERRAAGRLPAS